MTKTDSKLASKELCKSYFGETAVLGTACMPNWWKKPHITAWATQMFMISRLQEWGGAAPRASMCYEGKTLPLNLPRNIFKQKNGAKLIFKSLLKKPLRCTPLVKTWQAVLDSVVCFFTAVDVDRKNLAQINSTCANPTRAFVSHSFFFKEQNGWLAKFTPVVGAKSDLSHINSKTEIGFRGIKFLVWKLDG